MNRSWLEKIMNFMGFTDNCEEDEEEQYSYLSQAKSREKAPILSLHTNSEVKIMVVSPHSFEEVEQMALHLKNRKAIVVNLDGTTKDLARRIVDFLSGAVFALGGSSNKVAADTFLFVPNNVKILPETQENESYGFLHKIDEKELT